MSEEELIRSILGGDEKSFRVLVEQYQEKVFRTCMGLLHSREEADDIAQEVFIEVYQSLPRFRLESKLSTWIFRIAINKSLNQIKRNKRKWLFNRLEDVFSGRGVQEVSGDRSDHELLEDEKKRLLKLAMDSLPENQRVAFVLFRYEELSQREIADQMKITVPAVESLIHRAKQGLQRKLLAYYKNRL